MSERWTLGIDVGTTSVKALVLDAHGVVVDSASAHHGISEESDRVEVDAKRWWESMCAALAELTVPLTSVEAVGFSGNMSSVVLVDRALQPLRPALLLADTRGTEQLAALSDDVTAAIVATTGNVPETVFSLSSLLWLRDNEPETMKAAAAWLSSKDFLRARMTGAVATEPTDAGNALLLRGEVWNEELISTLGLPYRLFPPVRPSAAVDGQVLEDVARTIGLRPGIPVALGTGDVAAALVGSGGLSADQLAVSLGTSATLMAGLGDRPLSSRAMNKLTVHADADGGRFALGSFLTGGLALNWLRGSFGPDALAAASDLPLSSDLRFLPYLAGSGSPDFVPEMRGTVFGITPATRPDELVSALMEAISFEIADLIDAVGGEYTRIMLSGGGSRLAAWPQILADVTGIPISRFDAPDLSAVGAAVLAWRCLGVDVTAAGERVDVLPRFEYSACWSERRHAYAVARATAVDHYTTSPTPKDRKHHL